MENMDRLNAEWVSLNAFRGLSKIASQGDMVKSNYDNALQLGGAVYPELLGDDVSILKRERESDTAKEYKQKARLSSIRDSKVVEAIELLKKDISEYEGLLSIAEAERDSKQRVDQLKKKLGQLYKAKEEIEPEGHSENQLIFRDAYNVERVIPTLAEGKGYRDFELPNDKVMRLRVLHPDRIEHITGADLIYERHSPADEKVSIVAVQYKIWEKRLMYLSDERMLGQIEKMEKFLCSEGKCDSDAEDHGYRFPCCAAFLRPTDKLQKPDQAFMSTGEHLPICKIDGCKSRGQRGADVLEYKNMKNISLSSEMFEYLFNKGKIGSKEMSYSELSELYRDFLVETSSERVVIYAQEF
ncbi:hypothetical protein HXW73_09965 [Halomonas sp. SH5A2]|uniref:hypothetical protein n=1 Tax=Halomonas sp. SH5A2 TaxID=2749040 RepID=UPI0016409721|nr:hypothetical protein [Halomonas sp. SH5A2]QNI03228.1 hypothetical protein HXW73_09965 [Halomonas sp. SH5A2]